MHAFSGEASMADMSVHCRTRLSRSDSQMFADLLYSASHTSQHYILHTWLPSFSAMFVAVSGEHHLLCTTFSGGPA